MAEGAKDRFIEVAFEGVGPHKFNRQSGRPDERPENPAKLTAQKQIARQPRPKNSARPSLGAAQALQDAKQAHVRCDAREGDEDDLGELHKVVAGPRKLGPPGERWG